MDKEEVCGRSARNNVLGHVMSLSLLPFRESESNNTSSIHQVPNKQHRNKPHLSIDQSTSLAVEAVCKLQRIVLPTCSTVAVNGRIVKCGLDDCRLLLLERSATLASLRALQRQQLLLLL